MANVTQFDLEEYKALRAEIVEKLKAISQTELLIGGAVAAMYAWLAARTVAEPVVWLVPSVLVALGAARAEILGRQIGILGSYIQKLEKVFRDQAVIPPHVHGWEHYRSGPDVRSKYFDSAARAFWLVAFLLTLVFPSRFRSTQASRSAARADTLRVRVLPPTK